MTHTEIGCPEFREQFTEAYQEVRAWARRSSKRGLDDDALHDGVLNVWRSAVSSRSTSGRKFDPSRPVQPYLQRAVINQVRSELRRRRNCRLESQGLDDSADWFRDSPSPLDEAASSEALSRERAELERAFRELPRPLGKLLELLVAGASMREAMTELKVSQATVYRMRRRLSALVREGFPSLCASQV